MGNLILPVHAGAKTPADLTSVAQRGMARVQAAYGEGFKQTVLQKFPLSLADHHVLQVAVEHGWQDQWMIKEKAKRSCCTGIPGRW